MDCVGSHILLASQPLEIALFEVCITVRSRNSFCWDGVNVRMEDRPFAMALLYIGAESLFGAHVCLLRQRLGSLRARLSDA